MKQKTALEFPKSDKFKEAISGAVKRALFELKGKTNRAILKESMEQTTKHIKEKDFLHVFLAYASQCLFFCHR